jgi:hypothetical protein
MADIFHDLESDNIPLASIVGGNVDLDRLIIELEERWPDKAPRSEIDSFSLGHASGALSVIDYIKAKRNK